MTTTKGIIQQAKPGINIPTGREVIGAYGESRGVTCPHCGGRNYPRQSQAVCVFCEGVYLVPRGYSE